jgi:hypothetical protein
MLDDSCAPSLATGGQNQHVGPAGSRYYYDAFGRRRKNGYLDPKDTQIKHLDLIVWSSGPGVGGSNPLRASLDAAKGNRFRNSLSASASLDRDMGDRFGRSVHRVARIWPTSSALFRDDQTSMLNRLISQMFPSAVLVGLRDRSECRPSRFRAPPLAPVPPPIGPYRSARSSALVPGLQAGSGTLRVPLRRVKSSKIVQ